jgi:hypothetical protein
MQGLPFSIERVTPKSLLAEHQPHAFSLYLKELGLWDEKWPFASLEAEGLLTPVTVKKSREKPGGFEILDGFKRVSWAASRDLPFISCACLDMDIPLEKSWLVVLSAQKAALDSPALKAAFLGFLKKAGVPRETTVERFMPLLGLGPSINLLEKYLKIAMLPDAVLAFCHRKGFSAKRCLNLSHHRRGLLNRFFSYSSSLTLTASLAEELLDNINDILRRDAISPEDFFSLPEISDVLEEGTDTRARTDRFRRAVRRLRFPVLTGIERQMEGAGKKFFSGKKFSVTWDKSLENRVLNITASVKSPEEFVRLVRDMEDETSLEGIKALLSYL